MLSMSEISQISAFLLISPNSQILPFHELQKFADFESISRTNYFVSHTTPRLRFLELNFTEKKNLHVLRLCQICLSIKYRQNIFL